MLHNASEMVRYLDPDTGTEVTRLTPDGKSVLYTSDETGYEQVYIVRLPEDLTTLPPLESLAHLGAK